MDNSKCTFGHMQDLVRRRSSKQVRSCRPENNESTEEEETKEDDRKLWRRCKVSSCREFLLRNIGILRKLVWMAAVAVCCYFVVGQVTHYSLSKTAMGYEGWKTWLMFRRLRNACLSWKIHRSSLRQRFSSRRHWHIRQSHSASRTGTNRAMTWKYCRYPWVCPITLNGLEKCFYWSSINLSPVLQHFQLLDPVCLWQLFQQLLEGVQL